MKPIIILENPKYQGNVGMICRLVANFNLEPLRIIGEKISFTEELNWMAYNSNFEIERIQYFENLLEARKDIDLVFGTGMIKGKNRGEILSLSDLNSKISNSTKKIAVLFGREDKGLSNFSVDNSDYMIDFSLSEKQPSMNLSNSVAYVMGYYFNQDKNDVSNSKKSQILPTGINKLLEGIFDKIELSKFHNRKNLGLKRLRKILENGIENNHDSNFLFKIFENINFKMDTINEKNSKSI